jgi:sugar phosphate isomerase/epimerase
MSQDLATGSHHDEGVAMQVGLLTDGLADWSLTEILDWLPGAAPQVQALELGTGGYSPAPHCPRAELLADEAAACALRDVIAQRGLELAAFNVAGNPLHPDPEIAAAHTRDLRETIELAARLGVKRIVAMSGTPGPGPAVAPAPHFVAGAWLPDFENVLDWQWEERILPLWTKLGAEAAAADPELRICLELHPGTAVYNLQSFDRLSVEVKSAAVNLDPSHFFWQGADPLLVMGHLHGRIGFAHGKDTLIQTDNRALNGILDARWPGEPREMPWVFSTPGDVHDVAWWTRFVAELAAAGHDGTISIEYEDPYRDPTDGIIAAARVLEAAIDGQTSGVAELEPR